MAVHCWLKWALRQPAPTIIIPALPSLNRLPPVLQIKCLTGLADAKVKNTAAQGRPANFDEWIMRVMGGGIADLFMRPYNFKVGAQPWGAASGYYLPRRLPLQHLSKQSAAAVPGQNAFRGQSHSIGSPLVGHSAVTDCRYILLEKTGMRAGLSCKR